MDVMCFMIDLSTNGAMPVPCKIEIQKFNLVITLTELDIQLVVPMDAVHMVSTDETNG